MAIDESTLAKGHVRKLNALRKSIGDDLAEDAFSKWLARQAAGEAPKADPVAEQIVAALTEHAGGGKINLGLYGYTIRRARGKGRSGFVAYRNEKTT